MTSDSPRRRGGVGRDLNEESRKGRKAFFVLRDGIGPASLPAVVQIIGRLMLGNYWMKSAENYRRYLGRLLWLLFMLLSTRLVASTGQITTGDHEQTFPLLQTRTGTYTNVTVTKKTQDWIFILHSQGVCNIKASDLPAEARIALGYDTPPPKPGEEAKTDEPNPAQPLAQLRHLKFSDMQKFATGWRQNGKEKMVEVKAYMAANPVVICSVLGIVAVVYVFLSICFWLICRKTHIAPGPLVWVPFLQLIPLLRAANIPRVWFFAYFIPFINIIPIIMWAIKIVKSRGKNAWVAFLLILPPTTLFAFLYLAFSRSAPVQIERAELLALETA
jgi:hypothetical protein